MFNLVGFNTGKNTQHSKPETTGVIASAKPSSVFTASTSSTSSSSSSGGSLSYSA